MVNGRQHHTKRHLMFQLRTSQQTLNSRDLYIENYELCDEGLFFEFVKVTVDIQPRQFVQVSLSLEISQI